MPTTSVLRMLFGASLGLGVVDLVWVDLAVAPSALMEPHPIPVPLPLSLPVPLPMPDLAPPPVAPTSHGVPIYFATLHANLDPSSTAALLAIVQAAPTAITLEGHTDLRGGEPLNASLRRGRATATRDTLIRLGIPPDRITIRTTPQQPPSTELWRDRRVDITYLTGGQSP